MNLNVAPWILLSGTLAGCGPNFSGEHFAAVQGTGGANAPIATSQPAELRPGVAIRPDIRPLPSGLPALLSAYRQNLLHDAHPFRSELAEHFADIEVQGLRQDYAGRDADLEQELIRRLSPRTIPSTRPPAPGLVPNAYPAEEQSLLTVGSAVP